MQINTEQDMVDFCNQVNATRTPFYVKVLKTSEEEFQSRLDEILSAEPADKVRRYRDEGKEKELFLQGIRDITHEEKEAKVLLREVPVIYPYGRAKALEGPMTGVLVNCYDPFRNLFLFHMRGKDISAPFGFQAAAAGFVNSGESPYIAALEELTIESKLSVPDSLLGKSLAALPFMKSGYPQPLFLYGFEIDSAQTSLPVLTSMGEIAEFEKRVKEEVRKTGKLQEAYHFLIPLGESSKVVMGIYDRDPSQKGKNGGFFGPIKESHDIFCRYLGI